MSSHDLPLTTMDVGQSQEVRCRDVNLPLWTWVRARRSDVVMLTYHYGRGSEPEGQMS